MKNLNYLGLAIVLGLVSLVACNKSAQPPAIPVYNGVQIDFPKLLRTFENAGPDIQANVNEAVQGVRYGMYEKALMGLDKLANDPNVTEEQKKVVNEIMDGVKQVISKAPPQAPSQ